MNNTGLCKSVELISHTPQVSFHRPNCYCSTYTVVVNICLYVHNDGRGNLYPELELGFPYVYGLEISFHHRSIYTAT